MTDDAATLAQRATARPYQRDDQRERLGEPPWKPTAALILWEQAHGHDVRLKCYTEFGCLLIERDLEAAEAERDEALALLRRLMPYCVDRITCPAFMDRDAECTCGLEALLDSLRRHDAQPGGGG